MWLDARSCSDPEVECLCQSIGAGTPSWLCPSAAGFSFELPSRLFKQHSDNHNDSYSDQRRDDARERGRSAPYLQD